MGGWTTASARARRQRFFARPQLLSAALQAGFMCREGRIAAKVVVGRLYARCRSSANGERRRPPHGAGLGEVNRLTVIRTERGKHRQLRRRPESYWAYSDQFITRTTVVIFCQPGKRSANVIDPSGLS